MLLHWCHYAQLNLYKRSSNLQFFLCIGRGLQVPLVLLHAVHRPNAMQGMQERFDMIVCLLGTFSHMLDNKQAAACFQQVHQHLRPGGIFLLELAHPGKQQRVHYQRQVYALLHSDWIE